MKIERKGNVIYFPNKKLNTLDKLVIDFIRFFDSDYVIVSGYVAILFGRDRHTEDIDIFINDKGPDTFANFYDKIIADGKYSPINAEDAKDAYELMTVDRSSLRFAEKGTYDPNFEMKFARKDTDFYSLNNAWSVDLGDGIKIRISPMELEIAYKLYLGSEKDVGDAAHLYTIFEHLLDRRLLKRFIKELDIKISVVKKVLGEEL